MFQSEDTCKLHFTTSNNTMNLSDLLNPSVSASHLVTPPYCLAPHPPGPIATEHDSVLPSSAYRTRHMSFSHDYTGPLTSEKPHDFTMQQLQSSHYRQVSAETVNAFNGRVKAEQGEDCGVRHDPTRLEHEYKQQMETPEQSHEYVGRVSSELDYSRSADDNRRSHNEFTHSRSLTNQSEDFSRSRSSTLQSEDQYTRSRASTHEDRPQEYTGTPPNPAFTFPPTTHTIPIKKFACPEEGCSKSFTRRYNLSAHLRCHRLEKPFGCVICPQAFARKHDLQVSGLTDFRDMSDRCTISQRCLGRVHIAIYSSLGPTRSRDILSGGGGRMEASFRCTTISLYIVATTFFIEIVSCVCCGMVGDRDLRS